jgi:hypothetical protein
MKGFKRGCKMDVALASSSPTHSKEDKHDIIFESATAIRGQLYPTLKSKDNKY